MAATAAPGGRFTVPPTPGPRRADLSDVILYILTKVAAERGADYKILLSKMAALLSDAEGDLLELGIPVRFDRTQFGVSSRQVDQALLDVIPYGVTIQNPTFSLLVSATAAGDELTRLRTRLKGEDVSRIDGLFERLRPRLETLGKAIGPSG